MMRCSNCGTVNPDAHNFCRECGSGLARPCPRCAAAVQPLDKFCGQCGRKLEPTAFAGGGGGYGNEGERKHITVLFSDLSGYTAMTETLDPEDVTDIMGRIFGEIEQVVTKYEGTIDKLIGDAAMILFGVPNAHEDDPVRAIRAAREIHARVEALNRQFIEKVGHPLTMHSGINTGLVVTGEINLAEAVLGITGDTVNVAARLEGLAGPGQILVGPDTYAQSESYFHFNPLAPTSVKGKSKPIRIYEVLSPRTASPNKHRAYSRQTRLIGRMSELQQMQRMLIKTQKNQGVILTISGEAGTGKSRLVEEFRAGVKSEPVQWIDGQAYAYAQNSPYSLFTDLFCRAFHINEGDPTATVKEKVEFGIKNLVGSKQEIMSYVAELFSVGSLAEDAVSPEIRKVRLQKAIRYILTALAGRTPTVICLEDLHWADPSSLELIRSILSDFHYPLFLICVYRPGLLLISDKQRRDLKDTYRQVTLKDLAPAHMEDMAKSLLETDNIPDDLRRFIHQKVGGNPFYLEEVIHSLIESGVLVFAKGSWILRKSIEDSKIPPTIHGVISGRLDRLEKKVKRVLQEAAVIGRTFYYEILNKITELKPDIDDCLKGLEALDLIKIRPDGPDLEYLFKNALIQEVAYSSLLRKERRAIHERIGLVMEQAFADRLSEFYEPIGLHFKRGRSLHKAIRYLMKSGEKSLRKYALEESHRHFAAAYEILDGKSEKTEKEQRLLIDLLNRWSFVYYYRGRYRKLIRLLNSHKELAESLADTELLGMYYAWLGFALWHRERFNQAYGYMEKALSLGDACSNDQIIGYSCAWLSWTCTELGFMDKAIGYAERAQEIYKTANLDPYIYVNSLAGMGYALWHKGEKRRTLKVGASLLDFGRNNADNRSRVMGYCCLGWGNLIDGDMSAAAAYFKEAIEVSTDPWFSMFPKLALCYGFISSGHMQDAEQLITEIITFSQERGAEFAGTPAAFFGGIVAIAGGEISKGIRTLKDLLRHWKEGGCKLRYALCGNLLAMIYANFARHAKKINPAFIVKNLSFMLKTAPFIERKAAKNFGIFIREARAINARCVLGQAYLHWGYMLQDRGHSGGALNCFQDALTCFRQCDAETYLDLVGEAINCVSSCATQQKKL